MLPLPTKSGVWLVRSQRLLLFVPCLALLQGGHVLRLEAFLELANVCLSDDSSLVNIGFEALLSLDDAVIAEADSILDSLSWLWNRLDLLAF